MRGSARSSQENYSFSAGCEGNSELQMICCSGVSDCITFLLGSLCTLVVRSFGIFGQRNPSPAAAWTGWCEAEWLEDSIIIYFLISLSLSWIQHSAWPWRTTVGFRWVDRALFIFPELFAVISSRKVILVFNLRFMFPASGFFLYFSNLMNHPGSRIFVAVVYSVDVRT